MNELLERITGGLRWQDLQEISSHSEFLKILEWYLCQEAEEKR
jgi:hypothetical protein